MPSGFELGRVGNKLPHAIDPSSVSYLGIFDIHHLRAPQNDRSQQLRKMAGNVRQPIDVASLERYITANVPEIAVPIDIKQVCCRGSILDRS